jgi:hypothetical protein
MDNYTRANALAELDNLTEPNIRRANKAWKLDRLKALGVTEIKRHRLGVPVDKARSDELADAIIRERNAPREELPPASALIAVDDAELALLDETPEMWVKPASVAEFYFDAVRKLTVAQFDRSTQMWLPPSRKLSSLAARLAIALGGLKQCDSNTPLAPTSKLTFRRDVFAELTRLLSTESATWYSQTLTDNITQLREDVYAGMQDLAREKKAADTKRLNDRKEDVFTVDPTTMLMHAHAALTILDDNTPASSWKEVSYALAIATGRRMAEIHSTATFEVTGDHTLYFTGQAKTKGVTASKTTEGFEIPTLVSAELCAKGLQWLDDNEKRVSTPKDVHKRYSKALSDGVKVWFRETMPDLYASDEGKPSNERKCIYHKLRQIYGLCAIRSFRPPNMQDTRYLGDILGHDQDASVSDRYSADIRIADNARTHIPIL